MQFSWMWDGSDAQRRRYARSGFYLFCMLPTLLVASWILFPSRHDHWERQLAAILDMSVEIGHVQPETPNQTRLSELTFSDPTLGMIATSKNFQISELSERTVYTIDHTEIEWTELNRLMRDLQRTALRQAERLNKPFEIIARHVTLHLDSSEDPTSLSFDRLQILIERRTEGLQINARIFPSGTLDQSPIHCAFERRSIPSLTNSSVSGSSPTSLLSTLTLDTGDQTLPVQIAKSWWPSLRVLGGDCEFQGRAQIEQHALQTHASLAGKLSHVDLSELVTRQFPRILSGSADLELNEVSIIDNQLEVLVGRLHSNHGQIGQPFLKALQRELGLVAVAEVTNSVLPYQTLDVRFHLQGSTFQFAATQPSGYLITDTGGYPILAEGSKLPLKPQDLVRALVSRSQVQVPLTRQTSDILFWLPLPGRQDLEPESEQIPRGILRLQDSEAAQ